MTKKKKQPDVIDAAASIFEKAAKGTMSLINPSKENKIKDLENEIKLAKLQNQLKKLKGECKP